MRIAVMQPYLFPYLGYFQLLQAIDKFVLLDDVNYIARGWINRNRILLAGRDFMFSLPLKKAGINRLICEIELTGEYELWKAKFLKTLSHAYGKAPCYSVAMDVLEGVLNCPDRNLSGFLENSLKTLCEYLGIKTNIIRNSDKKYGQSLKAEEKIINISLRLGASEYVNAIGGSELYRQQNFTSMGLKLFFLKSHLVEYRQFGNKFIPWLSIIDLLMFNDLEKISSLLVGYDLRTEAANNRE